MQPGVRRREHALGGSPDRPGVRRAVVVLEEGLDRDLARGAAHPAAADAVGERDGNSLGAQLRAPGDAGAVKVLIALLASPVGMLAERDLQAAAFRNVFFGAVRTCVA